MRIAFITENSFNGKINFSNFTNYRTEFLWFKALDVFHVNWSNIMDYVNNSFDFVIFVPSKKHPEYLHIIRNLMNDPSFTPKIGMMQEGPCWYWQEWDISGQSLFLDVVSKVKFILCHNSYDRMYYSGLFNKPTFELSTMCDLDYLKTIPRANKTDSCLVNGNLCWWYNAGTAFLVANQVPDIKELVFPSMGRKKEREEELVRSLTDKNVVYKPYLDWSDWISSTSNCKYAINLMPTFAANSFSLNCACLGIPCVGVYGSDTQEHCFPDLTVDLCDTSKAKFLLEKLSSDRLFYDRIVKKAWDRVQELDYKVVSKDVINFLESLK